MQYAEVTVVVDGALEESETFTDYLVMDGFIDSIRQEAEGDGYPTEVFIIEHNHELDVEDCSCAQYLTGQHPAFAWNVESRA